MNRCRTWIPWTAEDYTLDFCKKEAARLREEGGYARVQVRRKRPEIINGVEVPYGRVYVQQYVGEGVNP